MSTIITLLPVTLKMLSHCLFVKTQQHDSFNDTMVPINNLLKTLQLTLNTKSKTLSKAVIHLKVKASYNFGP